MNNAYPYISVTDNKLGYDYMSVIDEIIKRESILSFTLCFNIYIYLYIYVSCCVFNITNFYIRTVCRVITRKYII